MKKYNYIILYIYFSIIITNLYIIIVFNSNKCKENIYFDEYVSLANQNKFINKIKYIPCASCGLGNKLLGLISSIAYGVSYSYSLKVADWDSLWWYFLFPLKIDNSLSYCNVTFKGHFYAIKSVIESIDIRTKFIKFGIIHYSKISTVMVNNLAYRISKYFLQLSDILKSKLNLKYYTNLHMGIHIRTGKADGKEYLLHYLKAEDISNILKFVNYTQNNKRVYISSDSSNVKFKYKKLLHNIFYINSSICNSGYGLLKANNKCAIEAITDYYMLSRCKNLILTRCSSFSLVSLFANEIGYKSRRNYIYFGNCNLHSDIYS